MSPIYDYFCPKCKIRVSDILVSAFGEPQYCQKCGAKLEKLPAISNVHFKGNGWTPNFSSNNKLSKEKNNDSKT